MESGTNMYGIATFAAITIPILPQTHHVLKLIWKFEKWYRKMWKETKE